MDAVEIVMEVEDRFGIEIPEDDYAEFRTVGEMHSYVLCRLPMTAKVAPASLTPCPSFAPFFALRRTLAGMAGTELRVRPQTELGQLLPPAGRRQLWDRIRQKFGSVVPELKRPGVITTLATVAGSAVVLIFMLGAGSFAGACVALMLAGMFIGVMLHGATQPLAVCFPKDCRTVGDVVRLVRPELRPGRPPESWSQQNPEDVWNELVEIVSEQVNIPAAEIRPESRFVEDLLVD
ncbi:MAG: hypothetical protein KDA79_22285 [Planctomycetaceae bacterium]|nr:hypothetical protein [Planctomycetaceae bacterium]